MTAGGPPLRPSWWDSPELRPVLAARDVAGLYRWLQRHGWSQTQIGAATCQSQGEVSEILAGRQVRAYDVLVRIADALEVPRGLMGLAYDASGAPHDVMAVRVELNAIQRRDFLGAVASVSVGAVTEAVREWLPSPVLGVAPVPDCVGPADVEQIRSTTAELRRLDQRYGGGAAVDAARGFYGWARGMLHSTADALTHRELKVALADFSSLVAWAFHDVGQQTAARRYLMNALVLARDADETALMASILYRLGRISMHQGQPVDALRMLQLGQIAAQDAGDPAEIARLHANEALAYAMLGKEIHIKDSLARAEFEMGRADPADVSPWTTLYFTPGDYTGHQALVYNALAANTQERTQMARFAAKAAELADDAIASSGPDRPVRSLTFDRIILATNQLRTGEFENGLAAARRAISESERLKSVRATERLAEIASAASMNTRRNSDTRELCQSIESVSKTTETVSPRT